MVETSRIRAILFVKDLAGMAMFYFDALGMGCAESDEHHAVAKSLGGNIDVDPPSWSERGSTFFLGYDPEGNVFGVSQNAA